jgi:hypothetical protein
MDLIGSMSSQLGIDAGAAQALAGGVLGMVRGQVAEHAGADTAAQIDAAVPELGGWQQQAASLLGGGGSDAMGALGGLLGGGGAQAGGGLGGALGGLLGGSGGGDQASSGGGGLGGLLGGAASALAGAQQAQAIGGLLQKVGLDASMASTVAPMVLQFLKSRLDPALVSKILAAAPMLAAFTGGGQGGGGGLAGALGGLGGLLGGD